MITFTDVAPALPSKLPSSVELLTSRVPEKLKPALAHAIFPALGAHLRGVKFHYIDNVEHEPAFMCCLLAKMSSGKSAVNAPISYILADILERDSENRQREEEYKELLKRFPRGENRPERPEDLLIQVLSPDLTNAAFVQRLKDANGHFLYSQMDEIELLNQLKAGKNGQQVSQILRLAFDCGNYGQERIGLDAVTANVRVRWNWNASSTIGGGQHFFRNDLMNGTVSRINFCTIEHHIGDDMPIIGDYGPAFAEALKPYIDRLNEASGLIRCPEAEELAMTLKDENAEFAQLSDNEAFETLSFRANLIAYHKAMLLYIMEGKQWSEEIAAFMRWCEEYDLWCKMRFFGAQLTMLMHQQTTLRRYGPKNMLDLLPDTFTREQLKEVRRSQGLDENPKNMLNSWMIRNLIERSSDAGTYKKTNLYLSRHNAA
jgi:hypothetical protein